MQKLLSVFFLAAPSLATAQLLAHSGTPERCEPAPANTASAQVWLDRAAEAVLPKSIDGRVLKYRVSHDVPLWEQSDRSYEPFIPHATATDRWYDLASGVEARQPIERAVAPGQYPSQFTSSSMVFVGRDTLVRPLMALSDGNAFYRRENPWLVLAEWRANATAARVTQRCLFRDAWRIVVERGAEKLYVSESDATPVKLDRVEPHYLWGQVHAEYVWSTWWSVVGGGYFPYASFRFFDGSVYERIGVTSVNGSANGAIVLVPRDSAPRLTLPQTLPSPQPLQPPSSDIPDTIRVAANTYQLVTRAYTETVALRRDTVFLLDATSSEARGRADSAMIATLFPGKHPVVVVVTDLAWPHVSSVRFWVARGATIVSHPASQEFLNRVVTRKWTLNPDALEKTTPRAVMRFKPVRDSLVLAGGDLVVHALRGTSTELALGVWMPKEQYFWAGDYVQNGDNPYVRDVVRTVHALGIKPAKLGAQHIKLSDWSDIEGRVQR